MPFLLAEILDFQGSAHLIGVGSLSYLVVMVQVLYYWFVFIILVLVWFII